MKSWERRSRSSELKYSCATRTSRLPRKRTQEIEARAPQAVVGLLMGRNRNAKEVWKCPLLLIWILNSKHEDPSTARTTIDFRSASKFIGELPLLAACFRMKTLAKRLYRLCFKAMMRVAKVKKVRKVIARASHIKLSKIVTLSRGRQNLTLNGERRPWRRRRRWKRGAKPKLSSSNMAFRRLLLEKWPNELR